MRWQSRQERSLCQDRWGMWRRWRSRTIWQSRLMLSGSGFSRSRWRRHKRCRKSQRRNRRACICKCPLWARSARRRWCWGGWWPHRKGRSRAGSTWTWTNWLQCPMLDLWQLAVMRLLHSFYVFLSFYSLLFLEIEDKDYNYSNCFNQNNSRDVLGILIKKWKSRDTQSESTTYADFSFHKSNKGTTKLPTKSLHIWYFFLIIIDRLYISTFPCFN